MKKITALAMIALFLFASLARAETEVNIAGTCEGTWSGGRYGNGAVTLSLKQEGAVVTGTIIMLGTLTFGGGEKSIRDAKASKARFTFSVDGDGGTIDADLAVKDDNMTGYFTYRGQSYYYSLKCVK